MQQFQGSEPMLLTIEETMKMLRVGRSKLYRMMGSEGLPVFRSGRYVRIPSDSLQQWIKDRTQQNV
ncbi:MAG TPA: helix-turn-helix domain-containing protein [Ktedonobacteraceae bacterium]|jgi:excisionase family DNA binding protein